MNFQICLNISFSIFNLFLINLTFLPIILQATLASFFLLQFFFSCGLVDPALVRFNSYTHWEEEQNSKQSFDWVQTFLLFLRFFNLITLTLCASVNRILLSSWTVCFRLLTWDSLFIGWFTICCYYCRVCRYFWWFWVVRNILVYIMFCFGVVSCQQLSSWVILFLILFLICWWKCRWRAGWDSCFGWEGLVWW